MPSCVRSSLSPPRQEKGAGAGSDQAVIAGHQKLFRCPPAGCRQTAQRFIRKLFQLSHLVFVSIVHTVLYPSFLENVKEIIKRNENFF